MAEYIEREAARDALYFADAITMRGVAIINQFPAADVKPVVRGEWIEIPSDGKFKGSCICSVCKKSPPVETWIVKQFDMCPYCGADMRGRIDEKN